jgi:hypothetical protein
MAVSRRCACSRSSWPRCAPRGVRNGAPGVRGIVQAHTSPFASEQEKFDTIAGTGQRFEFLPGGEGRLSTFYIARTSFAERVTANEASGTHASLEIRLPVWFVTAQAAHPKFKRACLKSRDRKRMLRQKILHRDGDILLYGTTPPKLATPQARLLEIAGEQARRINAIDPDGVVLYDIQDEAMRNPAPRPFPYLETVDPLTYGKDYLRAAAQPRIYYRAVGKYSEAALRTDIAALTSDAMVFVGAASRQSPGSMSLHRAYAIHREMSPVALLGGVVIPERHAMDRKEHERVAAKMAAGCSFFITQCVYNVEILKNLLSDYHYFCKAEGLVPVPVIVTLTPCGSSKTLEFMRWLGIEVAGHVENELRHAPHMLSRSAELCTAIAKEILEFARGLGVTIGFNVESVSIRKEEIEASVALIDEIRGLLR